MDTPNEVTFKIRIPPNKMAEALPYIIAMDHEGYQGRGFKGFVKVFSTGEGYTLDVEHKEQN